MNTDSYEIHKNLNAFLISICLVATLGIIMVFSASYIYAQEVHGAASHFFLKQLFFLVLSVCVCFVLSKTKFSFWMKYGIYLNIFMGFILILTFVPGIGVYAKGAHRWLNIAGLKFQPGEIVKYTTLIASLSYFDQFERLELKQKLTLFASILFPIVLLLIQPDFGSFTICMILIGFCCYLSKFPRKYFYSGLVAGVIAVGTLLFTQPYRVARLLTFLDPWKNPRGSGFQIIQSYLGFANGSVFGMGLGNSNEKLFYLPEAHNDFIFSVVGEELGFFGVLVVVALFLTMIFFGFKLALSLKERAKSNLIASVVFAVGLQVFLNMGVVLGLLPTKGLNLPFISYGGSSLISNFIGIGIIISAVNSYLKMTETTSNLNKFDRFESNDSDRLNYNYSNI